MKKLKQRVLCFAAATALFATSVFAGFVGNKADAAGTDYNVYNLYGSEANNGYSPAYLTEATLLVGEGSTLAAADGSAAGTIANAEETYFLGIASQFATFIEGNMTVTAADEEGRAAVGGNLAFTGQYNYQVGSGDYSSGTALPSTKEYTGITNFAHAIVGGTYTNIDTLSKTGTDNHYVTDDLYKKLVIGSETNFNNSTHYSWASGSIQSVAYGTACSHDSYSVNEKAQFYGATLIDFDDVFKTLRDRSETVAAKTATGTTTQSGTKLTFDATGCTDSIIYFNVETLSGISEIEFTNIPDDACMIVNVTTSDPVNILNGYSEGGTVKTTINNTVISNQGWYDTNNNEASSRILYNFANTSEVYIATNFNGTIFAPSAAVKSSETCQGHLSGAIIATSFYGGEEIGYRPFLGSIEILGTQSGYAVPVDKVDADGNFVTGATIGLYDGTGKCVAYFTSSDATAYLEVPTALEFDGSVTYNSGDTVTTTYTLKETEAPDGYLLTDQTYTIEVAETVEEVDGNEGFPTKVSVVITITDDKTQATVDSYTFEYTDTYNNDVHETRTIVITDTSSLPNTSETFVLTLDSNGDKVAGIKDGSGADLASYLTNGLTTSGTFTYNGSTYYYAPSSYMILQLETPLTFTNTTGLQFQKVDGSSNLLSGAPINLEVGTLETDGTYTASSTETDILSGGSKVSLDYGSWTEISRERVNNQGGQQPGQQGNQGNNVYNYLNVYRLTETAAPSGYDVGDDIYLVLYNGSIWYISASDPADVYSTIESHQGQGQNNSSVTYTLTGWTEIDTADLLTTPVQMVNYAVSGAKVNLLKYTEGDTTEAMLADATFELYAYVDGTSDELLATFTTTDALEDLGAAVNNPTYVDRGYLLAGTYYLVETAVPADYDETNLGEKLYFTVSDDGSVSMGMTTEATVIESNVVNSQAYYYSDYAYATINKIVITFTSAESWAGIQFKSAQNTYSGDLSLSNFTKVDDNTYSIVPTGDSSYFGEKGYMEITYWGINGLTATYYVADSQYTDTGDYNTDYEVALENGVYTLKVANVNNAVTTTEVTTTTTEESTTLESTTLESTTEETTEVTTLETSTETTTEETTGSTTEETTTLTTASTAGPTTTTTNTTTTTKTARSWACSDPSFRSRKKNKRPVFL